MTSDGDILFRAVCEHPADDTPRLVYADWLEENGQPERARFIRFQCEFPAWDSSHPRFRELLVREEEFDPFRPGWLAELPRLRGVKWWDDFFSRGFVGSVTFHSAKAFADHADAVFAASPVELVEVRRVTDGTAGGVLGSPYLGRLGQLILRGGYGKAVVRQIAACPFLAGLESLCVWGGCTDAGAEALAASPHLGGLRCLSFSGHTLTDRGVLAVTESATLSGVTDLVLHGTRGLSRRVVRRLKARYRRLD